MSMKPLVAAVAAAAAVLTTLPAGAGELVVGTVNNGHMIEMQKLTPHFEKANPGTTIKWVTLEEGVLRQRVTTDIATKGGQFDVMTIGIYETPIWAKRGWLLPIATDAAYDVDDLLPSIRAGLTHENALYAAPFYGESSILMYRKDLADKAGVRFGDSPTWDQVADAAVKMHAPASNVYGLCLRGKPGWGDNAALLSTMVNTFGGQWFDMEWKPQLTSEPWNKAVTFYVDIMKKAGPPGVAQNSFNENLALFNEGKCAMWVDASIAASFVSDPKQSRVADKVAFTQAPQAVTPKGNHWLWSWNLAIPAATKKAGEAQKFVKWATSREYIALVGKEHGWNTVPTGTRKSTYENADFRKASAAFASQELKAIESANPKDATQPKSPYEGIQYVSIPEFQSIGLGVGQQIAAALTGKASVEQALKAAQTLTEREMTRGGYYKK